MTNHLEVNIFPKLYVGIQSRGKFDTENFPLGFATPFEENAAFRKRKETVDNWAGYGHQYDHATKTYKDFTPSAEIIDNVELEGFTFDRSVSRWTTSNKWFRIQDPRGFTLEISAENLGDILINGQINKGSLIGKYVWARKDGNNYLLSVENEIYIILTTPKEDYKLAPGDIIKNKNLGDVQYMGDFFIASIVQREEYLNDDNWTFKYNYRAPKRYNEFRTTDNKKWLVFRQIKPISKRFDGLILMRKLPAKYDVVEKNSWKREKLETSKSYHQDGVYYDNSIYLFNNKKELEEFDLQNAQIVKRPD